MWTGHTDAAGEQDPAVLHEQSTILQFSLDGIDRAVEPITKSVSVRDDPLIPKITKH